MVKPAAGRCRFSFLRSAPPCLAVLRRPAIRLRLPELGPVPCRALLPLLLLPIVGLSACQIIQARQQYAVEIVTEGQTWDQPGLNTVLDALGRLPPHVVKRLGSRHYGRLHLLSNTDSRTLSGWMPYPDGANFYSNQGGRNQVVLYPNQGALTVLHELGHAYQMRLVPDGRYAWLFFQAEMRDFMAATGWRLLSSDVEVAQAADVYELRFAYDGPQVWQTLSNPDPAEDYASSFALFFHDPERLRQLSPVRYEWMRQHVATDER
jgi:hypothetical protein